MNRTVKTMIYCALFAALTAVCSQLAIPIQPVPINLALLSVYIAGGLLGGGSLLGGSDDLVNASAPQRRAFNDRAAEKIGKLRGVNDVAVLLEQVGHVQRNDDRKTKLENLSGQVQAALDVRGVNKVDHDVGTVVD